MKVFKENQFLFGLALGGVITSISMLAMNRKTRNTLNKQINIKDEKKDQQEETELMKEQLVRNTNFFGEVSQSKVQNSYIMIFGIGGVGSHVLSAIARAGVGKISIIDFDRVTLSSLNRHAFATRRHVNRSKVEVFQEFLKEIVPSLDLKIYETYVTPENVNQFFLEERKPDYVIDCIDNLDAKTALVAYCVQSGIKVISSCGAGMKADPTRIQIRDISETTYDSLARALRQNLKKYKIKGGFKVVYSNEQTERELLPLQKHQEEDIQAYKPFDNYRIRIVPVLGTMPALVAYSISSYVLCDLAQQTFNPYVMDDVKATNYSRLYSHVLNQAKKCNIAQEDVEIDMEDMYIIAREVYNWQCLVCDKKSSNLELIRWDNTKPFIITNLVPLYGECSKKHQILQADQLTQYYSQEILNKKEKQDKLLQSVIKSKKTMFK